MKILLFVIGILISLIQVNWPSLIPIQPQLVIIFILILTLRFSLSSLVWYCLVFGIILDLNSPWNIGISTPFLILICLVAGFGLRIANNPNQNFSLILLVIASSLLYQLITVVYASDLSLIGGVDYLRVLINLISDFLLIGLILSLRSFWISNQNHRRWSWGK
ncbi:rod shape-determining protein MreD [Candidatus Saccharibacteria bacterium]|nr:rod shape-determining protein MreD [Candidatus Saccharibacteria bacterium]